MATTVPSGWRQRTTNTNEYEAILDLGNFNKYEVNVNVQTGQRQIYTIDAVFRTRELLATVNADGTVRICQYYGDLKVGSGQSQGVVLTSPNGTQYRLVVSDAGALSTTAI